MILESSNRSSRSSFQKELGNFLSCEELRPLVRVTLENAGSVGLAASGGQNGQNMLNYGNQRNSRNFENLGVNWVET